MQWNFIGKCMVRVRAIIRLIYSCLVSLKVWKTQEVPPAKLTIITPQNSDLSNLHALLWEIVHKAGRWSHGRGPVCVHTVQAASRPGG